jgi:VWA-like domain (DUF2201)
MGRVLQRPVPDVAIVCNTSGSMTPDQLGRALAEVEGLLGRVGLGDNQVRVLSCDAEDHTVRRVSRASQIELVGGGGTDMAEGITQAVALRPRLDRRGTDRRVDTLARRTTPRSPGRRRPHRGRPAPVDHGPGAAPPDMGPPRADHGALRPADPCATTR